MTRFDWQAYEDGSMDVAMRHLADQALAESDEARRELLAFRSFREALRTAALAEQVPIDRLQATLRAVASQRKPASRTKFYWAASGLAAAALAVAFFMDRLTPRIADVAGPALATETSVTEPKAVRDWLAKETGMPVPNIQLTGLKASLTGASHGRDWVAWNVTYQGTTYKIYGRQCRDWFSQAKQVNDYMKPMFVDGKQVGWYCAAGMAYVVQGGTEEGRYDIARRACLETPSAVQVTQNDSRQSL